MQRTDKLKLIKVKEHSGKIGFKIKYKEDQTTAITIGRTINFRIDNEGIKVMDNFCFL